MGLSSLKMTALSLCGMLLVVSCKTNNPIEPPPVVIPDDAIDLSANGGSNCYIVKPGSTMTLNSQFKGNSTTETIGTVASAQLGWQDTKSLISKVAYVAKENKILVTTSDLSGNAVIYACNSDGAILWSWHLWVSNYNPEGTLFTTTSWKFMDRNIGALNATPGSMDTHGMLYQWGRKDPFTTAGKFTIMNEDYTYVEDGEKPIYDITNNVLPKFRELAEYHGTIEKSIKNPRVYYAMTYKFTGELDEYGEEIVLNDYLTKDWVDVSNDDHWGGVSFTKTIYDPCPAGYKVPVCDASGNTPYAWLTFDKTVWDESKRGCTQDGMWFPAVGTRVYASGGLDCGETSMYSGMWIGTAGKASSTPEIYPELYGQYMFIINGKRTFKVTKDARSQGLSVRCVKE